jgi:hypothetical protein
VARPRSSNLQTAGPKRARRIGDALLNAYAFGTMGTIAGIAAIAAFIAAAVMLILGGLGLMHARRVSPAADILARRPANAPNPGTVPPQATHPSNQQLNGDVLAAAEPGSPDHSA